MNDQLSRRDAGALRDKYLAAQLSGDRREALRLLVDALEQGATASEAQKVVQEAQREIGRLWQEDRISVAQEHMATAISQLVLSHIYQQAQPRPPNGKKVIVACVHGEFHEFPSRLVADALDLAGFDVRYLGANVPTASLLGMITAEKPDLLVLSATMMFNLPSLRSAVTSVRQEVGRALPIAIGGAACASNGELAQELDTVSGADAAELVLKASRLLGVGP